MHQLAICEQMEAPNAILDQHSALCISIRRSSVGSCLQPIARHSALWTLSPPYCNRFANDQVDSIKLRTIKIAEEETRRSASSRALRQLRSCK